MLCTIWFTVGSVVVRSESTAFFGFCLSSQLSSSYFLLEVQSRCNLTLCFFLCHIILLLLFIYLFLGGAGLKCKFDLALSHIVVCLSSQLGASYFQLGVQSRCNLSLCFPLSNAQSSCDTQACLSLRMQNYRNISLLYAWLRLESTLLRESMCCLSHHLPFPWKPILLKPKILAFGIWRLTWADGDDVASALLATLSDRWRRRP